jgi:hypothetical protein
VKDASHLPIFSGNGVTACGDDERQEFGRRCALTLGELLEFVGECLELVGECGILFAESK